MSKADSSVRIPNQLTPAYRMTNQRHVESHPGIDSHITWSRYLSYDHTQVCCSYVVKGHKFSVRCIKD